MSSGPVHIHVSCRCEVTAGEKCEGIKPVSEMNKYIKPSMFCSKGDAMQELYISTNTPIHRSYCLELLHVYIIIYYEAVTKFKLS